MVCEKCEGKLKVIVCPDPWKAGARNTNEAGRKATNTLITKKSDRSNSNYVRKCRLCKQRLHLAGYYCQDCAYKKGICCMCGVKVLNTKMYKQSTV
uniref:Cysteine-rich PDZ-binding protein n=1 Tax=Arcella intermedia TaxID=1963864 RepID=A0A6B2LVE1_9EUKA